MPFTGKKHQESKLSASDETKTQTSESLATLDGRARPAPGWGLWLNMTPCQKLRFWSILFNLKCQKANPYFTGDCQIQHPWYRVLSCQGVLRLTRKGLLGTFLLSFSLCWSFFSLDPASVDGSLLISPLVCVSLLKRLSLWPYYVLSRVCVVLLIKI